VATLLSSQAGSRPSAAFRSEQCSGAPGVRVRISPAVSVEFLYRDLDQNIPPRVDCRLMFAGSHLEQTQAVYREAVRLFSEFRTGRTARAATGCA
jgi:hypothetical protein